MPLREMQMARFAWWAALAAVGFVATACGDPCGASEDRLVPISELPCAMTNADGAWESHPFPPIADEQCYWLEFRGCSTYEIAHPLGRVPSLVVGYTSFDQDGSFSTVGSGNSFVVQEASNSTVTLRNAQNQLFYLRLVLE
jgi:hypothetical protein